MERWNRVIVYRAIRGFILLADEGNMCCMNVDVAFEASRSVEIIPLDIDDNFLEWKDLLITCSNVRTVSLSFSSQSIWNKLGLVLGFVLRRTACYEILDGSVTLDTFMNLQATPYSCAHPFRSFLICLS